MLRGAAGETSGPSGETSRRVGRYAIHEEIASGGMASVHLGRLEGPVGFARTVAIKRLHPHLGRDPEFLAMFLDEARLAARVRHPNVVATIDVVADAGEVLLVLEFVHGASLWRLVRAARAAKKQVPIEVASGILVGVLAGLHAAHDAKREDGAALSIVHRDVSPQNVLVGTDGVARVLDFGIAKAAWNSVTTRDGQVKGKLAYMSPEQVHAAPLDRRADVYAAAVVLWEVLTGERMHSSDNPAAVVRAITDDVVAAPSTLRREVPAVLDEVCLRGLAKERDERFSTAREMARALERAAPPATAGAIGEWVEATAADELARLADLVARVEGGHSGAAHGVRAAAAEPGTSTTRPSQVGTAIVEPGKAASQLAAVVAAIPAAAAPPARGSRALIVVAVLAVGAVALALAVGQTRPAADSPTGEPAQAAESSPRIVPSPSVVASEGAASLSAPVSASAPASASASSVSPAAKRVPAQAHPTSSAHSPPTSSAPPPSPPAPPVKPGCSPAFVVRDGIKRYKPECL